MQSSLLCFCHISQHKCFHFYDDFNCLYRRVTNWKRFREKKNVMMFDLEIISLKLYLSKLTGNKYWMINCICSMAKLTIITWWQSYQEYKEMLTKDKLSISSRWFNIKCFWNGLFFSLGLTISMSRYVKIVHVIEKCKNVQTLQQA